jgi:hypothetical protein
MLVVAVMLFVAAGAALAIALRGWVEYLKGRSPTNSKGAS